MLSGFIKIGYFIDLVSDFVVCAVIIFRSVSRLFGEIEMVVTFVVFRCLSSFVSVVSVARMLELVLWSNE